MFAELSRLFKTPARLKLLKFFALQPHTRTTAEQAATTVGVNRGTAEAEVRALAKLGVLTSRKQGKKTFYAFSLDYPNAATISTFLEEATWPTDRFIVDAFRGVPGVMLLVATGALMHDTRPVIDLLIVTRRSKDALIKRAVRKIEVSASFPIRYAVLDPSAYQERKIAHDRLLRDVFEYSHKVLYGKP